MMSLISERTTLLEMKIINTITKKSQKQWEIFKKIRAVV